MWFVPEVGLCVQCGSSSEPHPYRHIFIAATEHDVARIFAARNELLDREQGTAPVDGSGAMGLMQAVPFTWE